jgi:hypothetical protein
VCAVPTKLANSSVDFVSLIITHTATEHDTQKTRSHMPLPTFVGKGCGQKREVEGEWRGSGGGLEGGEHLSQNSIKGNGKVMTFFMWRKCHPVAQDIFCASI